MGQGYNPPGVQIGEFMENTETLDASGNPTYASPLVAGNPGANWKVIVDGSIGPLFFGKPLQVDDKVIRIGAGNTPADFHLVQGNLEAMTVSIPGYGQNATQAESIKFTDPDILQSAQDNLAISPRGIRWVFDARDDVRTVNFAASPFAQAVDHAIYLVDCSGGDVQINLLSGVAAAVRTGQPFYFIKTDSTSNKVIINANGVELIGTRTELLMDQPLKTVEIRATGAGWCVIGGTPRVSVAPPQFAANQNDYNPAGFQDGGDGPIQARILRLDSLGNNSLRGLKAPNPPVPITLFLLNDGPGNITITDNSGSSVAENRFLTGGSSIMMNTNEPALVGYDPEDSRWKVFGKSV